MEETWIANFDATCKSGYVCSRSGPYYVGRVFSIPCLKDIEKCGNKMTVKGRWQDSFNTNDVLYFSSGVVGVVIDSSLTIMQGIYDVQFGSKEDCDLVKKGDYAVLLNRFEEGYTNEEVIDLLNQCVEEFHNVNIDKHFNHLTNNISWTLTIGNHTSQITERG